MKSILLILSIVLLSSSSNYCVQGRESVAELRKLRALGYSGNGHFGGDNGRDHPATATSAPVATTTTTSSTVSLNEAMAMEEESDDMSQGAKAAIGVAAGVAAVAAMALAVYFMSKKQEHVAVPKQTAANDSGDLESETTASDSPSVNE